MNNQTDKCYKCRFFCRYYTRGVKQFNRTKFGWGYKRSEVKDAGDCCEIYIYEPLKRGSKKLVKVCLNDLLTEISEVRKVIEAERDERREN